MRPATKAVLITMLLAALSGCRPADPVQRAYATTIAPAAGRTSASMEIATGWRSKLLTLDKCIDFAFELLDGVRNGTPVGGKVPASVDATSFAGAVLDATIILERELPVGPEHEIFWQRLGGLAFAAAEEARAAGRGPEALGLVLGGAKRWQSDAYWYLHPTHDGLVSWLMAEGGMQGAALQRLAQRPNLEGFAKETYEKLGGRP